MANAVMADKDETLEPEKPVVLEPEIPPNAELEGQETEAELKPPEPTDELWEGGPTWETITNWKKQFGDDNIYVTSLNQNKHVVWRTISRLEYRGIVKKLEEEVANGIITQAEANMNNEEMITSICLLYPQYTREALSQEMAGLASILSQEILEASAFIALDVRRL